MPKDVIRAAAPVGTALAALALLAAGCGTVHAPAPPAARGAGASSRATSSRATSSRAGTSGARGLAAGADRLPACTPVPNPGGPIEMPGPRKPPPATGPPSGPASGLGAQVVPTMGSLHKVGTSSPTQRPATLRCVPLCPQAGPSAKGGASTPRPEPSCPPETAGVTPTPVVTVPRAQPTTAPAPVPAAGGG